MTKLIKRLCRLTRVRCFIFEDAVWRLDTAAVNTFMLKLFKKKRKKTWFLVNGQKGWRFLLTPLLQLVVYFVQPRPDKDVCRRKSKFKEVDDSAFSSVSLTQALLRKVQIFWGKSRQIKSQIYRPDEKEKRKNAVEVPFKLGLSSDLSFHVWCDHGGEEDSCLHRVGPFWHISTGERARTGTLDPYLRRPPRLGHWFIPRFYTGPLSDGSWPLQTPDVPNFPLNGRKQNWLI